MPVAFHSPCTCSHTTSARARVTTCNKCVCLWSCVCALCVQGLWNVSNICCMWSSDQSPSCVENYLTTCSIGHMCPLLTAHAGPRKFAEGKLNFRQPDCPLLTACASLCKFAEGKFASVNGRVTGWYAVKWCSQLLAWLCASCCTSELLAHIQPLLTECEQIFRVDGVDV